MLQKFIIKFTFNTKKFIKLKTQMLPREANEKMIYTRGAFSGRKKKA